MAASCLNILDFSKSETITSGCRNLSKLKQTDFLKKIWRKLVVATFNTLHFATGGQKKRFLLLDWDGIWNAM
jgi:hypothetical protein